jgi:N-acetyl sugar amidotransferase
MNRCKICIYPDTRPDTHFVDGVCSACREFETRKAIDWDARLQALRGILDVEVDIPYHCVVPVSGGKDSTYQILKLQELGARVLAVNSTTDLLTPIGRRNLDNLKNFCDVVEVSPCKRVRKAMVRIGLFLVGDLSWPEHIGIWSIPTRVAMEKNIPLVVWGEQPQREYATPEGVVPATRLDKKWVDEFGGLLGLRLSDVVGREGLSVHDLDIFQFPIPGPRSIMPDGIWLGDYLEWDGWKNGFIAQQYGFEVHPFPVETSAANYENLDNYVTVLRDYFRYLKYGYTRGTDILCNHVRRGRLTRDEALMLEGRIDPYPVTSLGKPIEEVLAYFDITLDEFNREATKWGLR